MQPLCAPQKFPPSVKAPDILQRLAHDQRFKTPVAMNLMVREGLATDIAECIALYRHSELPYDVASWRVLPEIWRTLLLSGKLQQFLVEDRSKQPGSRIVAFCAFVFVTDAFCAEAQRDLPPYLGVQLAQSYLSQQLPVLDREQIARANTSAGLNVVMCFQGCNEGGLSRDQVLLLREKQSEALRFTLIGYQMKELLVNPIGEEAFQYALDAGARLRRDYSSYFRENGLPMPEASVRPWLVGLTKEEAFARPGSLLAGLFVCARPRFHFTLTEQAVLKHALIGETCEDLADSLHLSPWTVKKRWQGIYERVAAIDGELMPAPIADGAHAASRGAERRRRLLHYLRQHLEELRPSCR